MTQLGTQHEMRQTPFSRSGRQAEALGRAHPPRGGAWDYRRGSSWRRSGPKPVTARRRKPGWGRLKLTDFLVLAGGLALGLAAAHFAGLL